MKSWGLKEINFRTATMIINSKNLKLTTTLDMAITQNPSYVPLNLER